MKTLTNSTIILKAIDIELRKLLRKDLENFRMENGNKQDAIKKAA
jgi:hypothetical protein